MAVLDLDVLVTYLDGEQNEYGLDFAATHGFLCATVVGPELKGWRKHLFDGDDHKVPAEILARLKRLRLIQALVTGRLALLMRCF
jgi:uncharacterized protein